MEGEVVEVADGQEAFGHTKDDGASEPCKIPWK